MSAEKFAAEFEDILRIARHLDEDPLAESHYGPSLANLARRTMKIKQDLERQEAHDAALKTDGFCRPHGRP